MKFQYTPSGVCSRRIAFDLDGDVVRDVTFEGGCHGNSQGVSALCEGMNIDEVIERLQGIHCGYKPTSCPDQLTRALTAAKNKLAEKKSSEE